CVGPKAELGRWALPTTEVRWSPDFPLSAMNCFTADSDRPADSWRLYYFSRTQLLSAGMAHRICLTPGSRGLYTEAGRSEPVRLWTTRSPGIYSSTPGFGRPTSFCNA